MNPLESVSVGIPATCANLGPGFDICGMALSNPRDRMIIERKTRGSDTIHSQGNPVPVRMEHNTCGPVLSALREEFGIDDPLSITIEKGIKTASGLGSSASSAAGLAVGLNALYNLGLSNTQLVEFAGRGEVVASGVVHYDNVAPAIFGGICVTYNTNPLEIRRFDPPDDLVIGVILLNREKGSTQAARAVLGQQVLRKDAQHTLVKLAQFICGLADRDSDRLAHALDDALVEPARAQAGILYRLNELKEMAKKQGFGACASGAGPTLLVLGRRNPSAQSRLEEDIGQCYDRQLEKFTWTSVSSQGAQIL